jgi:signal transduction histidine kinase
MLACLLTVVLLQNVTSYFRLYTVDCGVNEGLIFVVKLLHDEGDKKRVKRETRESVE